MGQDELRESEWVTVPSPVRFVVATELLLPEVVQVMVPVARVLPDGTLDSRGSPSVTATQSCR